jgi:hypothetical protein
VFCPNCGKEYVQNQNYCRFCGQSLKNEKYTNEKENEIDLTINQENQSSDSETNQDIQSETELDSKDFNDYKTKQDCENPTNSIFSKIFADYVEYKDGEKKLTPKAIVLIIIVLSFVIFMGNILWSINEAIQINPSMTNDNALMNIPSDEERTYSRSIQKPKEENSESIQEEETSTIDENQSEQTNNAETEETEELHQREQQFPEPVIPEQTQDSSNTPQ